MKKRFVFIILIMFLSSIFMKTNFLHAVSLAVGNNSIDPGTQEVIVPVDLAYSEKEDKNIIGMALEIDFDALQLTLNEVTAGHATQDAQKWVHSSSPSEGKIRIAIFGLGRDIIDSGTIVNINFAVQESAAVGVVHLHLLDVNALDSNNNQISVEILNGTITIAQTNPISITMSLPKGWSLFSVPVCLENKTVNDVFGDNAKVVYDYEKDHGYIRVKPDDELKIGYGYWLYLSEAGEYTFTGEHIVSYERDGDKDWCIIGGISKQGFLSIKNGSTGVIYYYEQGKGYLRGEADKIEPGKGYWLLITDVTTESSKFTVTF